MDSNVLTQPVQEEQFDNTIEIINESSETNQESELTIKYAKLTKEELLAELRESINATNIDELKSVVDAIKIAFYKRNKSDIDLARKEFLASGRLIEEFVIEVDNHENELKELINRYKEKRNSISKEIEQEKEDNFKAKSELIDKLKNLTENCESNQNAYNDFLEIQKQWREIGNIPKEKLNDTWNQYHYEVESFYNIIKINRELRDMDLRKNFEFKTRLCEEAEALSLNTSVIDSFKELQMLHDKWREIGPVSKELKDELWDRFKSASSIINKNHQQYFDTLNEQQTLNLNLKRELCEKAEAIANVDCVSKKEWDEATENIINIQKTWKTIGFAPKKDNAKIYETFRTHCNNFFDKKQNYFKTIKSRFEENLQTKINICRQAELLQDSEDWQTATNEILKLQKEWKESGAVPPKDSDKIWKQFRSACDHFFDRKNEHYKKLEIDFAEIIKAKESIIENLKVFMEENPQQAIEKLKEIQRQWSVSGHLPQKIQNKLYSEYKELIDAQFTKFKKNLSELDIQNFKHKVSSKNSKQDNFREKDILYSKLQKLESDLQVLENNIGFFCKSKSSESVIKDFQTKIEQTKESISTTKKKINLLNSEEKNSIG